jgi:hypothetical protein
MVLSGDVNNTSAKLGNLRLCRVSVNTRKTDCYQPTYLSRFHSRLDGTKPHFFRNLPKLGARQQEQQRSVTAASFPVSQSRRPAVNGTGQNEAR